MIDIKPSQIFNALSDEIRLRIVRMLSASEAEITAGQLAEILSMPPSHLSRHLQLLISSGLVASRRDGKTKLVKVSTVEDYQNALYAAVLSIPDRNGIFEEDIKRLCKLTGINAS